MATYAELQAQIKNLQLEAEKVRKVELSTAITEIKAMMLKYGVTLEDLGSEPRKNRKSQPSTRKYRDPASGTEWSGRGKPPKWMKDYQSQGKTKDDFLVQS